MFLERRGRTAGPACVAALLLSLLLAACTGSGSHGDRPPPTTGGGSATSTVPSGSSAPSGGLAFSDCSRLLDLSRIPTARRHRLSVECARVTVPLDYTRPAGPSLSLAVLRMHYADQPHRVGSLLVNPGGPGGSGITLAVNLAASMPDDMVQHFDIVGFDPRGTGLSAPVKCFSAAQEDHLLALSVDVRTTAGLHAARQVFSGFAAACNAKYGASLPRYATADAARDLDRIRAALGERTISYLGFSYGTELGAVWAHLFPTTIRVAVLDGAVDPTKRDLVAQYADQAAGFEQAFDQFAADCATRDPCRTLGDARQAVYSIRDRAATNPIPTSQAGDRRRATGSLVVYGVAEALYSRGLWPALGQALVAAQGGDAKALLALADEYAQRDDSGQYANLLDAYYTVTCNDVAADPSDATIQGTARTWATQYPMFGLWQATQLAQCAGWQRQRTPIPPETAPRSAPILVVGNRHDPATPYAGAVNLTRSLGRAELLSWDGEGHTSYLQGSPCVDRAVESYLITAALPPADTSCPAR